QPGVPLLTVASSCPSVDTQIVMSQQRFFIDPSQAASPAAPAWQIPACFKVAPAAGKPNSDLHACQVVDRAQETFNLREAGCREWTFANMDGRGYYRTEYSPEILRALAPRVEEALSAPERVSIVGDEWALVRAGRHTVAEYLGLL